MSGRLLAVSTDFACIPIATAEPADRERDEHDHADGGEPLERSGGRAEPDQQADAEHERDAR